MARRFLIWYWSSSGGGGGQYAVKMAQRLALRFGDQAVRLSLHAEDPWLEVARGLPVETIASKVATARRLPLSTALNLPGMAQALAAQMRDVDCVIVPMNFAAAAPLATSLSKPLVYVAHDPVPHPGDYAPLMQRAAQAMLIAKSTRVIAPSHYAARELARVADLRGKLHIVPLSAVFEPKQERGELRQRPVRLLFGGRMIAYKGVDILIDALRQISDRDDWRLTVAGAGPALDAEAMQAFRLPQVASVTNAWLSEAQLEREIAACDVMLAPYRSATQSGLLAQALAYGKPCVVTPVGGLTEQIGDGAGGWIAERADGSAFAAALTQALDAAEGRQVKAQGALALSIASWRCDYWSWLKDI